MVTISNNNHHWRLVSITFLLHFRICSLWFHYVLLGFHKEGTSGHASTTTRECEDRSCHLRLWDVSRSDWCSGVLRVVQSQVPRCGQLDAFERDRNLSTRRANFVLCFVSLGACVQDYVARVHVKRKKERPCGTRNVTHRLLCPRCVRSARVSVPNVVDLIKSMEGNHFRTREGDLLQAFASRVFDWKVCPSLMTPIRCS